MKNIVLLVDFLYTLHKLLRTYKSVSKIPLTKLLAWDLTLYNLAVIGIVDSSGPFGSDIIACIKDSVTNNTVKETFSILSFINHQFIATWLIIRTIFAFPHGSRPIIRLNSLRMALMRENFLQDIQDYFSKYLK